MTDQEAAENFANGKYDAQGPIEHQMPWSDVKEAFLAGHREGW